MGLDEKITTVIFDLDGTLLPMDAEHFAKTYFTEIAKKAEPMGYDAKTVIDGIWAATKEVINNDGSAANVDKFWDSFSNVLGEGARNLQKDFDKFYTEEFHDVKTATQENPHARLLIDGLKKKGLEVIVATNPVFPLEGNKSRLSWVELSQDDFCYISSYENSSYCKPNVKYYEEILQKTGKTPEECIMVGNDVDEDMVAANLGMDTFLVTDCLINRSGADISSFKNGSFSELVDYMGVEADEAVD